MEKRKKIFDNDGVAVEEVVSVNKKNTRLKANLEEYKEPSPSITSLKMEDVLDSFAGYLPAQVNFMTRDGGQCLICGKETSSSMRKICFECLQKNGEKIYKKAKEISRDFEKEISV